MEIKKKEKEYAELINFVQQKYGINNFETTDDIVQSFLSGTLFDIDNIETSIERIFALVCDRYGVTKDSVKSKSRKLEVTEARQMIVYQLMTELKLSSLKAGERVNRDHSTALHAKEVIQNRIATNQLLIDLPF